VHTIGLRILRGDLKPGDALPGEEELRLDQSVSRTVLREAVRVLAAKGLVHARPKTGTRVSARSQWNVVDPDVLAWRIEAGPDSELYSEVTEMRLAIEPQAARLTAVRASGDEIAAIAEAYAGMEAGVRDQAAYLTADLDFHERILTACHNGLLAYLGAVLRAAFRATFEHTTSSPRSRRRALPLHHAILAGIQVHDGDAAEAAMRTLIADTAADIRRSARRRRTLV